MYGSPAAVQSREAKKIVSKVKGHVSSFNKLVLNWDHNCSESSKLLRKLCRNLDSIESIRKAAQCRDMASIKALFPDLFDRLIGNIIVEIEDIFLQIKTFMRNFKDIDVAMQLQVYESMGLISSLTTIDVVFDGDDGFVTCGIEDILDLEKKYSEYNQRLLVKERMIASLLIAEVNVTNVDAFWLDKSLLSETLDKW